MSLEDLERHGLRVTTRAEEYRLEVIDLPRLRKSLGDKLLLEFARAFAVADRLVSIHHLLGQVRFGPGHGNWPPVARGRDSLNLILYSLAFTREAKEIIGALSQAGVPELLTVLEPWNRLVALKDRWSGSGFQSDVRSRVAFHFDIGLFKAGLETWTSNPPPGQRLTILHADSRLERHTSFPIGHQLTIDQEVAEKFVTEAKQDPVDFADNVQAVFLDVLRHKGAEGKP